jgi:GntR family transcriptional regulator/MocR family aminotransferase
VPDLDPAGIAAGLHLVTWLPPDLDETAVVSAAARRGIGVYGLAPYRLASPGPGGLIFGYATLGERTITEGISILAAAVSELRST